MPHFGACRATVVSTMYLSSSQLAALRDYKYASGTYGYLDTVMTPFWNAAVNFLPMTIA